MQPIFQIRLNIFNSSRLSNSRKWSNGLCAMAMNRRFNNVHLWGVTASERGAASGWASDQYAGRTRRYLMLQLMRYGIKRSRNANHCYD
jgi:hypothetical protein